MKRIDELAQEVEMLRDRLSRLSQASLRINDSLDLETVLQDVLDSASLLTTARYGVITTLHESGQPENFLSSGLSMEERRRLWELPGGWEFFDYLSKLQEPLRLKDFHSHVRAQGLPEFHTPMPVDLPVSFLSAPVRHRGKSVGHVFLAEKECKREFTTEDEETLVMFASQAALVIANARRYQDEQRARASLETLIDTSPVGVVVFDAKTGAPVSINREAVRLFEALCEPGTVPEQLLEIVTVRRADGREISLQEFSLSQAFRAGEIVRVEEITISVPDGRSITTLINATPIRSQQEDSVDSFVVTLQDLTSLEETERLRAEFLATMSHELRVPLASIKGSAATVLRAPSTVDPAEMIQFFRIIDQQADHMSGLITDLLDVARIETGTLSVAPEPADVSDLVDRARNTFLSAGGKNNLHIDLPPDLPMVMADKLRIAQVLANLLSNASKHSPELSVIRVSAARAGVHLAVTVADEGIGLSTDRLPHLFSKFSHNRNDARPPGTASSGLGLAICKGIVETLGGRIWAESDGPGLGTRFTFTLPAVAETGYAAPAQPVPAHRSPTGRDRTRILVVDDDPNALRYIRDALSKSGFEPVVTADPQEALRLLEEKKPQLVLLDLMLPGSSGIDLMNDILSIATLPVIFLSAYSQEDVIAKAFDMGAVDYVVKPFSKTELAARIRAALRKHETAPPSVPYRRGDLTVDFAARSVTVAGRPLRLTAMEFRLLAELSANAGRTLTYNHLLQRVWGLRNNGDLRPLRTTVKSLRRNLGDDAANPQYIFTEPRIGYRMAQSEESEQPSP